jgi:hypothetical protein
MASRVLLLALALLPVDADLRSLERPLRVEGASGGILRASVLGPEIHRPEYFSGIEDYHNPRLRRLRDEYRLDAVVGGEANEFRRMLALRHWVHTRWPIDNDQKFEGDAFAILEKAKTGAGFHCTHSMTVQHAVMSAMGYVARDLGVDRNHEDRGRSNHHGVNEVWSNDFAKWVILDAKYDVHFERGGVPLSALDLHEAVRTDGGRGIVRVRGLDRREEPMEQPESTEASVRGYWWVSFYLRPNPFTERHWTGNSRLLILDNDAFRSTTWLRQDASGLVKHWAYAAGAFIPARSRHEIEWTPGVPELRFRQVVPGELHVQLRSATPNFKGYLVREGAAAWRALAGESERWVLREGENRLEVRTQNLFGVLGPVVSAVIQFKPEPRSAGAVERKP